MNKKYFLTFAAIAATVSPIVAVVSCSCGAGEGNPTTPTGETEGAISQITKLFEGRTIRKTYAVPAQPNYNNSPISWSDMQDELDNWCGENPIELGTEVPGVTFNYKVPEAVKYSELDEREITIKIKKGTEEKEVTLKLVAAANVGEADSQAINHIASKFEGLAVTNIDRTTSGAGDITTQTDQNLNEGVWNQLTNSGTMSGGFKFPKRLYGTILTYSVSTKIDTGDTGNIQVKVTKGSGTEVTKDVSLNLLAGQDGAAKLSNTSITLDSKPYTIKQNGNDLTLTVPKGTAISKNDIIGWFDNAVGTLTVTGDSYDANLENTYNIVVTDPGTGSRATHVVFNIAITTEGPLSKIAKLFEGRTIRKTYQMREEFSIHPVNWSAMQLKLDDWCGENPIELGTQVPGVSFCYHVREAVNYGELDEREVTIKIKKGTEEKQVTLKLVAAANVGEADSQAINHIASKFEGLAVTNIDRTTSGAGDITTQTDQNLNEGVWNQLTNSGTMSGGFTFPKRLYGTTLKYSVPIQINPGDTGDVQVKVAKNSGTVVTKNVLLSLN